MSIADLAAAAAILPKAAEDFDRLQSLIHPMVGREILSTMLGGIDLSPYPLDEPLPDPLGRGETLT